jgi:hypothetical protein
MILENIQYYDEEYAHDKGYYSMWNKDFKPKNKLEELEYKLGQLNSKIDMLEMGDNSILYNTDIYANKYKILKLEIATLKNKVEQYILAEITAYIESSDDSKDISDYTLREIAQTAYKEFWNYYTE